MDDTQKVAQITGDDSTQGPSVVPPVQPQQPIKTEEVPVAPVSVPSRESGPSVSHPTETHAAPSMPEVPISKELHEIGVEAVSESPTLTPEDVQAGVVHAKESTPVASAPAATIVLPMTQQQAQQTVKVHKKVKDSLFWLAMLIMRQWQIANKRKT